MASARPKVRAALAANLRALMEKRDWSQTTLEEKSGISQRHISNVLNNVTGCSVERLDALAEAFGLPGWLLLISDLPAELLDTHKIPLLVNSFRNAGPDGQELVTRLADREAHHNAAEKKLLDFPKRKRL